MLSICYEHTNEPSTIMVLGSFNKETDIPTFLRILEFLTFLRISNIPTQHHNDAGLERQHSTSNPIIQQPSSLDLKTQQKKKEKRKKHQKTIFFK